MAPRTSWKGFLKLSLISVPVRAFTAHDTTEEVHLNQLHAGCNARVRYKKVCPEHGELAAEDIVSGYEYAADQYVVIDPAELDKLRPASDKAVRIDGFVAAGRIDPLYHAGKTWYLLPDGVAGAKPYALLRQGMLDAGVEAVAQVVVTGREQLVLLRPIDALLALTVLTVAKRVKAIDEFKDELEPQDMSKEELSLTGTLISASTLQDFDFSRYEDVYAERLSELIRLKVEGQEVVQAPDPEEPRIINLMDALKKSVAEAQASSARKMAASVKTARRSATSASDAGSAGGSSGGASGSAGGAPGAAGTDETARARKKPSKRKTG